jgi:hypothetical protein
MQNKQKSNPTTLIPDFMMLIDDPNSLQRGWLTSDEA